MNAPGAIERVLRDLERIKSLDVDPSTGRLFTYIYETGLAELRELARRAMELFMDTNALDPTVFRSALFFEREVVRFAREVVGAGEEVVGTATYGGTESIILAVKAARWRFRRKHGSSPVPEVVLPVTGHPSIRKAAHYLGMKAVDVPVDPETKKVDVEALKEAVNEHTALIVVSAPNFPYGTIDPVGEVAGYARDRGVPVHVDACLGGYILPFMRELGEPVPPFAFDVEGVSSLSMDAHKYGYAPKGVSILLFRGGEYKQGTIFVDLKWPGYPFINTTILSSRSVAPLAAAWAIMKYLGREGYLELTRRILEARARILAGMVRLGFKSVAPVESPLLALTLDDEEDLFKFYANMSLKGWVIGLQPRVEGVAPYNIHLTLSPIHEKVAGEFLEDARRSLEEPPPPELGRLLEEAGRDPLKAASRIGETPFDSILIARLLGSLPGDLAEELARGLVVEFYR